MLIGLRSTLTGSQRRGEFLCIEAYRGCLEANRGLKRRGFIELKLFEELVCLPDLNILALAL